MARVILFVAKMLLIVTGVVVLMLVAGCAGERALVYFPSRSVAPPEQLGLVGIEQASFTAEDGVHLRGWFAPAGDGADRHLAVLYCHGNGGNVAGRANMLHELPALGLSVLVVDWRGYGESDDVQPTEQGLYRDGRAALAWLQQRTGLPPDRIVFYGESLGCAVAVELAAEAADAATAAAVQATLAAGTAGTAGAAGTAGTAGTATESPTPDAGASDSLGAVPLAPHALILQAPFTSLPDVAGVHYPWLPVSLLLRDSYDSASKIGRVRVPLLVLHGTSDNVVPFDQGRALEAAAGGPHQLIELPGTGHNDTWRDPAARRADVAAFLDGIP